MAPTSVSLAGSRSPLLCGPRGRSRGGPACGPSFQAVYECDVRFEHCYALDQGPRAARREEGVLARLAARLHVRAVARPVEYAATRFSELSLDPDAAERGPRGEARPQPGVARPHQRVRPSSQHRRARRRRPVGLRPGARADDRAGGAREPRGRSAPRGARATGGRARSRARRRRATRATRRTGCARRGASRSRGRRARAAGSRVLAGTGPSPSRTASRRCSDHGPSRGRSAPYPRPSRALYPASVRVEEVLSRIDLGFALRMPTNSCLGVQPPRSRDLIVLVSRIKSPIAPPAHRIRRINRLRRLGWSRAGCGSRAPRRRAHGAEERPRAQRPRRHQIHSPRSDGREQHGGPRHRRAILNLDGRADLLASEPRVGPQNEPPRPAIPPPESGRRSAPPWGAQPQGAPAPSPSRAQSHRRGRPRSSSPPRPSRRRSACRTCRPASLPAERSARCRLPG